MPKLKQVRERAGYTQAQTARELHIDRSLINKFENFRCLPTPEQAIQLCELWKWKLRNLYTENELLSLDNKKIKCAQAPNNVCTAQKINFGAITYNYCVRVKKSNFPLLTKNVLNRCGLYSNREFLCWAYRKLEQKYKKLLKKEQAQIEQAQNTYEKY